MLRVIALAGRELLANERLANAVENEQLFGNGANQDVPQNSIQAMREHAFNLAQDMIRWVHQTLQFVVDHFPTTPIDGEAFR